MASNGKREGGNGSGRGRIYQRVEAPLNGKTPEDTAEESLPTPKATPGDKSSARGEVRDELGAQASGGGSGAAPHDERTGRESASATPDESAEEGAADASEESSEERTPGSAEAARAASGAAPPKSGAPASGSVRGPSGGERAPSPSKPKGALSLAPREGARWADPIAWFEQRWTWFESRLITFVLLWQIAALVSWVFLNGLSESVSQSAGVVFRATFTGLALGLAAWFGGRRLSPERRLTLTLTALAVGLCLAPLWRSAVLTALAFQKPSPSGAPEPPPSGLVLALAAFDKRAADYFDNIKGWLQGGSTLTLMGGLRGLGTRLTLWLALLGGSLATAAGKHIHIDVIFRFLPKKLRVPAAAVNYTAAMLVCFAGAWGFFDHIAIESYGARADDARSAKIERARAAISDHLFFTRKQLGLDLRSLPHVLAGERYDQWMTAADWNQWIDGAGFEERFSRESVEQIRVPKDAPPHPPLVLSPAGESAPGMLAHTLSLVFPFGLLAIGLRFLIRALLTLSGHLSADPDEAHKEDLQSAAAPPEGRGPSSAEGDA